MQENIKATQRPWHIGIRPGPMIYGPSGEQIVNASPSVSMLEDAENRANLQLIVDAANSYDRLRRIETAARDFLRTRDSQLEEGLDDAEGMKRMFNTRRCLEALRNALEGEK